MPTTAALRKPGKPFVRKGVMQLPTSLVKKGSKPMSSSCPLKVEDISLKECAEMSWFRQTVYASKVLKLFGWDEGATDSALVM